MEEIFPVRRFKSVCGGRIAAEFAAGVNGPAVVCIEDMTRIVENMRDSYVALGQKVVKERLLLPVEEIWNLDEGLHGILGMTEPYALCEVPIPPLAGE